MASLTNSSTGINAAFTLLLIFSILFLPTFTVKAELISSHIDSKGLGRRDIMIGSRPPRCVNKCLSCRPCMATLVIPPHHQKRFGESYDQDDNYYLLSWKCKCGNKLFQP